MLFTCTMNPSLDYYMEVDGPLISGQPNRSTLEYFEAGGKGINVSIVLSNLGIPSSAFGFVGGFTKDFYISLLAKYEEIRPNFTYINGHTRINVKCHAEEHTNLNATGPYITRDDMKDMMRKVGRLAEGDYLVVAGITQEYLEAQVKEMLVNAVNEKVKVVLDTNENLMREMLPYHPFMIKCTSRELEDLVQRELPDENAAVQAAREVYEQGAENVIILQEDGTALLVCSLGCFKANVLNDKETVNTVGTGDSMVAGFLMDYLRSRDTIDAFRFGASCGSATAYSKGFATREKIDSFYKDTEVIQID